MFVLESRLPCTWELKAGVAEGLYFMLKQCSVTHFTALHQLAIRDIMLFASQSACVLKEPQPIWPVDCTSLVQLKTFGQKNVYKVKELGNRCCRKGC